MSKGRLANRWSPSFIECWVCGQCRPFFDIFANLAQHCKFDRNKVRNLLAAVGSDDEDEDFGALFSQLARCYFYTVQFTRQSWQDMSHSQMLGKFEYGGGLIFKVVLEC